ncbi:TetR/AcrR family transcriptional regulator [Nocardioides sp. KR10-350]|uniref:TetR/AcrR family transcriptional regulator n=1 Tax=Nocardioides cheoyonin TaxID=3156615 RepID=UPI0032B37570
MAGRRRHGEELERAIHAAVLAELEERGYAGTTYDGVAARARTSKPVLYRRWPTRAELVLSALIARGSATLRVPDTGSLRDDLTGMLRSLGRILDGVADRPSMLRLLAESEASRAESLRTLLLARGAELLGPVLDRARERGELGTHPLPERALSLPFDLVRHEVLLVGRADPDVDSMVTDVVLPLYTALSGAPDGS